MSRPPKPATPFDYNCLMCKKPFKSTGRTNRVCDKCKKSSTWQDGIVGMPNSLPSSNSKKPSS